MRLRRGTWPGYLFLALALLLFLTFLPYVILGEWDTARETSSGFATLITGWVLRGWHDAEKLRRSKS